MKHSARVLEAAPAGGTVLVSVSPSVSCQRCARGAGCGMGTFNSDCSAVRLSCSTEFALRGGELVSVEFDDEDDVGWLWLVAGAYGLPTLGLVGAVVIVTLGWSTVGWPASTIAELWQAVAALVGLAGGILAWRTLAPGLLARRNVSLRLQSGRIVAIEQARSAYAS